MTLALDRRPIVVALAELNGAGKTTFYHAHLQPAGLRLVNADAIARELNIGPFRLAAVFEDGRPVKLHKPVPKWLKPLLPGAKPR
jgi:hypothetical protein